jgi:hypothetical protein
MRQDVAGSYAGHLQAGNRLDHIAGVIFGPGLQRKGKPANQNAGKTTYPASPSVVEPGEFGLTA